MTKKLHKPIDDLKKLVFDGLLVEDGIDALERRGIPVTKGAKTATISSLEDVDFSPRIRNSARRMSSLFEMFFCLENSVRELIQERLLERHGAGWWEQRVPKKIREAVQKLKAEEEKYRYLAQRSESLVGYTLFGNLAQIIISNWEDFSDLFPDQAWVTARFTDLEKSRNIIMHTGVLPQVEAERIESIVRDYLRQVG